MFSSKKIIQLVGACFLLTAPMTSFATGDSSSFPPAPTLDTFKSKENLLHHANAMMDTLDANSNSNIDLNNSFFYMSLSQESFERRGQTVCENNVCTQYYGFNGKDYGVLSMMNIASSKNLVAKKSALKVLKIFYLLATSHQDIMDSYSNHDAKFPGFPHWRIGFYGPQDQCKAGNQYNDFSRCQFAFKKP